MNYEIFSDEMLAIFVPTLLYWVSSGIYVLLSSFFKEYRLHSKKDEEKKNRVSKATVIKVVLLLQTYQVIVSWAAFKVRRKDDTVHTGIENKSYFKILAGQFIIAMLVFDTCMYFMHRLMHENKFLYKHIHSHHHRLVVNYAFGSQYGHFLDVILLDNLCGTIAFLVSGMSTRASIFFFSFVSVKGVNDHCALWFPGNPFNIFSNNSAFHDIHHQIPGGKYNLSQPLFVTWDKLLGTYMPYSMEKKADGGFIVKPAR